MLRQVKLSIQLQALRSKMDNQETARQALAERRAAMAKREAELEEALKEVTDQTSEEDKALLDEAVSQHETDSAALAQEEQQDAEARADLQKQIDTIQQELEEIEKRTAQEKPAEAQEKKGADPMPNIENRRSFFGMSHQERDAFFAREDMKSFVQRMRDLKMQNRAVTGAQLLIPDVLLGVIREQVETQSKLLKHVNFRAVKGTSRVIVPGTVPEAVWTEMCDKLNELEIGFSNVEMDGYKVGGYFVVCNSVLADADAVSLATEFVTMLAAGIAKALDKAILFGAGTKQPLGIVTRLAQTAEPSGYSATARKWVDLSTTNMVTITTANSTGIKLFKGIFNALGKAKTDYAEGELFWVMNEATHLKLVTEALEINAAGAITTGIGNVMPVKGGAIEIVKSMPDNMILAGYGGCYMAVEREGVTQAVSEHTRFIEDQTVFRATARYDGTPVIPEAFVFIGIDGTTPSGSTVTFPEDAANNT